MIGYLILLIIVVVFISTIGIKLLINTSLFIVSLTQKTKTTQKTNDNPDLVLPPEIFNLPEATNTAVVQINGRSPDGVKLTLFVNDEEQKEIAVKEGAFDAAAELKKGDNTLYLKAEDSKTGKIKTSRTYFLLYKDEKPNLDISSPADQDKTSKNEISVIGQTDRGVSVRVNNVPVVVDAEGKFAYTVKLKDGENRIMISAVDQALNTETKELVIFYVKDE